MLMMLGLNVTKLFNLALTVEQNKPECFTLVVYEASLTLESWA